MKKHLLVILCLLTTLLLAGLPWVILKQAPAEASMNVYYKIFYLHLPLAWWALLCFFSVFASSILYLWQRKSAFDLWAKCATETGVLFCVLTIASGSIWAKLAWNTWWRWEPKLTTSLIVCLVYAGCIVVRGVQMEPGKQKILAAVLGIIAFADVPFIFLATRILPSAHPPAIVFQNNGLALEMLVPLAYSLLTMGLLWLCLTLLRFNQEKTKARLEQIKTKIMELQ